MSSQRTRLPAIWVDAISSGCCPRTASRLLLVSGESSSCTPATARSMAMSKSSVASARAPTRRASAAVCAARRRCGIVLGRALLSNSEASRDQGGDEQQTPSDEGERAAGGSAWLGFWPGSRRLAVRSGRCPRRQPGRRPRRRSAPRPGLPSTAAPASAGPPDTARCPVGPSSPRRRPHRSGGAGFAARPCRRRARRACVATGRQAPRVRSRRRRSRW